MNKLWNIGALIISHRHKFIFLKTRKTAGTSIEITLSKFCDDNDIVTRISDVDEKLRKQFGGRAGKDEVKQLRNWKFQDLQNYLQDKSKPIALENHVTAPSVRSFIGQKKWDEYYKFSIDRNPWDKYLSRYYWRTRNMKTRPSIKEYYKTTAKRPWLISCWDIYSIDNVPAVDRVFRFENLVQDFESVGHKLGLDFKLPGTHAKGAHRPKKIHYRDVLDSEPEIVDAIANVCRNEIEYFGYEY